MGFSFRVAKGVRVYPSSRGISVGAGPVRYYTRAGGGGRSRGATSTATRERQLRQQARLEEIQAVIELDRGLVEQCSKHKEEFPASQPPVPINPEPVDERALLKQLDQAALRGISTFKFGERRAAKQQARDQLEEAMEAEGRRRAHEAEEENAERTASWEQLLGNQPQAVLGALEAAFADNEAPAAAVNCERDRVDLLMRWPAVDHVVHERKSGVTPTGRPTMKKRTKTEVAEFYLEAMSSNALATIKEAFAVAPGINEARLLVVRGREDPAIGRMILEVLFFGLLTRAQLEQVNWERVHPTATFLSLADGRVGLKGKNKQLLAVDVSDDPEVKEVLRHLADELGWTAKPEGVVGSAVPGQVVIG